MAAEFHVGYVDHPMKGDGWFRGCLAIPYLTPSGVVSFKFRAIGATKEDRFRKDKGDPTRIFNTTALTTARKVVITEGELDVVAATQCGLQAVGVPGATQWKSEWTRVFRNREVTILADGDSAGEDFAEMVSNKIYGCRVVAMPPGEDVCSMLKLKGERWIWEAVTC